MPETRSLDDLRSALQAWSDEACEKISTNLNAYIATVVKETWQLGSNGNYNRFPTNEFVWKRIPSDLDQLPGHAALSEAAMASSVVGPLMNQDVGTAIGLSSFDFNRFALAVLPRPAEFMSGQVSSFASRYERLTGLLTPEQAEYRVTYFLQNVSLDQDRVELEPGLAIERLTQQEIEEALGAGILRPVFGTIPIYQPAESAAFGLKKTWRLAKIVGGGISSEQRDEIAELVNPGETAEELLQCFALMSGRDIYATGTMTRRIDDDFSMFATMRTYRSQPSPRVTDADGFRLGDAKCVELRKLWQLARSESFPQNKALALAIRRLGFATQRTRPEDRLIDVLIAAEAFYLTDSGDAKDRGELKYCLALRAAVWSEGTLEGWTRREVFAQMRRAYDLRSVVAHGGEPKAKDVKIKEARVSLLVRQPHLVL